MNRPPREPEAEAFFKHVALHPRLERVIEEVKTTVSELDDGELGLVGGPTGVGKSTALTRIYNDFLKDYAPFAAPGAVPILAVEAPGFGARGFSLKDLYHAIQLALDEPGVGSKIDYPPVGSDIPAPLRRQRETESAAKRACLEALRQRGVRIILLDEAQHLCQTGGDGHITALLESIKSLASASGVRIVLFGTYALEGLLELNAQLSRRTQRVHFDRYHKEIPADRVAFKSVLANFEAALLVPTVPLVANWEALYDSSLGCVGLLKKQLRRALDRALRSDGEISLELLLQAADPARPIMLREIEQGEPIFSKERPDRGRAPIPALTVHGAKPSPPPFKRKPVRDPCGPRGSVSA